MNRTGRYFLGTFLVLTFVTGMMGCNRDGGAPATNQSTGGPQAAHDHEHDEAKIAENLATLSPEDRALAEKQEICPVSDEPLGSMGPPKKVTVADREVFICCEGCESKIKENPDNYLAKLPQQTNEPDAGETQSE